ncbi:MAG: hypothetical protein JJE25_10535 [Bacteroidia bacterium]|nr:hypothetical protein [Bacteroidia bacterium]
MKSKLILLSMVAGALSFTACNKGVSEETKTSIATFEAAWAETGTMATNWSTDLTNEYNKCKTHVEKQTADMTAMPDKMKKDENMMAKMTEMDNADKANMTALEGMTTEWNTFKTDWETNTADYTAWKEKVDKGEISNDEATKAMADWNTKLENAKNQLNTWNTAYSSTKEKAEKDMAACDAMMSMPMHSTPADKKMMKK